MKDYFSYNDIQIPGASFRISPSSIGKFFDSPVIWYKENILKQKQFTASTATVLGTIMHAAAEGYCEGVPITRPQVEAYILASQKKKPIMDPPILTEEIRELYPDMCMNLVNEYVKGNKPTEWEVPLFTQVLDDIYVGGTCDNRTRDIVVDYKSASIKPNTDKIHFPYLIQLLAYAYCYRAQGIDITRLRIVYVVRPTKTLPVRTFIVNHIITPEDWTLITDTLLLIAESIQAIRSHPELTHLIFKSMKLKETD